MTSVVDIPHIPLIADISIQECSEELIQTHDKICANLKRLTDTTEEVAFSILESYQVTVSLLESFKGTSFTFTEESDKATLDRYKQLVYTFIQKAEVYANDFFPSLSMSVAESDAKHKVRRSLTSKFTRNYYYSCAEKVGALALKKLGNAELSTDLFSARVLDDNTVLIGACRNYKNRPLPCISTVEPAQIEEEDLKALDTYRLSKYVTNTLHGPPPKLQGLLFYGSYKKILALIQTQSSYRSIEYKLLPDNKIEVCDYQSRAEKEVIQITDEEGIKLLEAHKAHMLSLALADGQFPTWLISKELADLWLKKSKEEVDGIINAIARAKEMSLEQVTGFSLQPEKTLRVHYSKHGKECTTTINLTEEQKSIFSLHEIYQEIAKEKEPKDTSLLTGLYKLGADLGLYQTEEN